MESERLSSLFYCTELPKPDIIDDNEKPDDMTFRIEEDHRYVWTCMILIAGNRTVD